MDQQQSLPNEQPNQIPTETSDPKEGLAPDFSAETQNNVESTEKSYVFHWNYEDQLAFDLKNQKKKKRRGALSFAIVMALAFLACIILLVGVLLWNELQADQTMPTPSTGGTAVADVAERMMPSTVLIEISKDGYVGYGTGFFVRSDGYIATNYHVIDGAAAVQVTLYSGRVVEAHIVGSAPAEDIAVLKISGNNYPVLAIGDSNALRVGDTLIAVGNPGGTEAPWTTTQGIVSALNREITVNTTTEIYDVTMFQTDAALNPGNSGGPLCNVKGEVVGIASRKQPDTEGICFALPINGSMELINAIIRDGHAKNVTSSLAKSRPLMGITGFDIRKGEPYTYNNVEYTADADGIMISMISESSGAYGVLQVSDILIGLDEHSFTTMDELKYILYRYKVGDEVTVTVIRDGETRTLKMKLGIVVQ